MVDGAPGECPSEDEVLELLEGRLPTSRRLAVDAHLGACSSCRRLVSALARADDATDAAPVAPPSTRSAAELGPGAVVAGKYEILSVLGRGGMGVVFLAFHRTLRQRVALKFLLGDHARDRSVVSRFFREARAAAALGSDHVVRILDADREPVTGEPFVALEYLEGRDLARVLREDGPLPIAAAVDCALQAAEALALAHRQGIVHRDIKPANLFLVRQPDGTPRVKVLDFGIAKVAAGAMAAASTDRTGPATILGSPRYMAPEQLRDSSTVDPRADVWALGITLYELLAGEPPFDGSSLIELCASIATDPPRPLAARRPDAPPALERAIAACLEKDRERRVPDMGTLAAALAPFAGPEGALAAARAQRVATRASSVPPLPVSIAAVSAGTPAAPGEVSTIRATSSVTSPPARSAWAVGLVAVACVGGAVTVAFGFFRMRESGDLELAAPASTAATSESLPVAPLPAAAGAASAPAAPVAASASPSASVAPSTLSAPTAFAAAAAPSAPAPIARPGGRPPSRPPTPLAAPASPAAPATAYASPSARPSAAPLHRDGLTDRK